MVGLFTAPAVAVEIDNTINEPVATSTADNGSPDDIIITEDGNIEFEFAPGTVAVTIDSDNSLLNEGDIVIEDSDDVIGVLIEANRTGQIVNDGRISLIEDYDREDDDDDDDLDGPLAIGTSRTAILLEEGGAFNGDIIGDRGSFITVEGNDSAGIRLLSDLNGELSLDGSISVTGDNARGLEVAGEITGNALISSSVVVTGEDAIAVSFADDIGGALTVESNVSATGFTSTSASNYVAPANVDEDTDPIEERRDPDDLLEGGPALAIGGSVGSGILVNGGIDDFISEEDADDEIKDTIEDYDENRTQGSITSFGSAPALLITPDWQGDADGDLVIGTVVETVRDTLDDDEDEDFSETLVVFTYDHSFINRGLVSATGVNVGFESVAADISGSADGQFRTIFEGGMFNSGSITSNSVEASSTALRIGSGVDAFSLTNEGSITASISTQVAASVTAMVIEEDSVLNTLDNSGTIRASSQGDSGEVVAIVDNSNTLSQITNTGRIEGLYSSDGIDLDIREDAVALDLSASTIDIELIQREAIPLDDVNDDDEIDGDDVADPRILGQVLFGSGDDLFRSEFGDVVGDVDFGAGSNTFELIETDFVGDATFSGDQGDVSLGQDVFYDGDLIFESGDNSFTMTNGATFGGDIINNGDSLDIMIDSSELRVDSTTALDVTNLDIQGASVLEVSIDPSNNNTEPLFDVSGTASIGSDAQIRPLFTTVSDTDFTRTLIAAPEITFEGTLDDQLLTDTRFLYDTQIELLDTDNGDELNLVYTLKTSDELGMDSNQASAYASVLEVFEGDDDLGFALASVTDEDEFYQIYNQLLPQRSEASTRFLSAQSSAAFGALADQLELARSAPGRGLRGWIQEHYSAVDIDDAPGAPGYNGAGFGFSIGLDRTDGVVDVLGLFATLSTGEFEEKTGGNNPVATTSVGLGAYAQHDVAGVTLRATGQVSTIGFESSREVDIIIGEDDNLNSDDILDEDDFFSEIDGSWNGLSTAFSVSALREFNVGRYYMRPEVALDYFALSQDAYTETTTREDELTVSVSDVDTDRLSAAAKFVLGARFGESRRDGYLWGPEMHIGYRSELSSTPYEATVQYTGATDSFEIVALEEYSDALLGGLSLSSNSERFSARLTYSIELMDNGAVHYAGAAASFRF